MHCPSEDHSSDSDVVEVCSRKRVVISKTQPFEYKRVYLCKFGWEYYIGFRAGYFTFVSGNLVT